jgi:hypothetical protein
MDSLLTLPLGDFRAVELTLRLTVALVAMTALLLLLSISCTAGRLRLPLILASVALLGSAWFESGVWLGWKQGFELAGTSYCVTGQLLSGEDRIVAWSLGVPAILFCFGLLRIPWGEGHAAAWTRFCAAVLLLALVAPFSNLLALALLGWVLWFLCSGAPSIAKGSSVFLRRECLLASASIALPFLITLLGGWHLLPLGKSAEGILVCGEIIRSLCDILSLVVPAVILLTAVLRLGADIHEKSHETSFAPLTTPPITPLREKKSKPRDPASSDLQSGLFGS